MRKLNEDEVAELMQLVEPGERIVLHCVPSRAFRVVTKDDVTFRMQQLTRQGGDQWVTLSTHTDNEGEAWASYPAAAHDATEAQRVFLLEMRKIKVERNQLQRELDATRRLG